jgi:hypothetical protein
MDQQDQGRVLKTERRTELDGGLDQRSGIFAGADRSLVLQNFRLDETGSLTKRKGGTQLVQVNAAAGASTLPAPNISVGAGGSLAAGTYFVAYTLGTLDGAKVGISASASVVAAAGSKRLTVYISPVNSGEGMGTVPLGALGSDQGVDDPLNGGYINLANANLELYVKKDADALTKQTNATFAGWTTGILPTNTGFKITLDTYTTNGGAAPASNAPIPLRALVWHPGLETTLGVIGELGVYFSGVHTTANYLAQAYDRSGQLMSFSRLPTKPSFAFIDNVACVTDGMGKPKRLNCTSSSYVVSPDRWAVLGANPPVTLPGTAVGAGTLTGTYLYVVTYTYQTMRADGSSYTIESNSSPTSNPISPAAQGVTVTIPTLPANPESTLLSWSIYRTVAGGSQFFFVVNQAIVTTTYLDTIADATITADPITPPDSSEKPFTNEVPIDRMQFLTEYAQRLWAVKCNTVKRSDGRILRIKASNELRYSKGPDEEGPMFDAWPSQFAVKCGSASPVTSIKSFRSVLYVFKQDEIGVIDGSADLEFEYRTIWRNSGAMENSVVEVDDALMCFDNDRTALRVVGYTVQDVGYDAVQPGWRVALARTGSELAAGGGRGQVLCQDAVYDPLESEIRWTMSEFTTDFTVSAVATTGTTPGFYEYVLRKRPDGSYLFSIFTGAVSSITADRRVMATSRSVVAANPVYGAKSTLYADYHGRLVQDNTVEYDLNPSSVAITIRAVFPYFFGDNPTMVRAFRYIFLFLLMGSDATDSITVATSSLAKTASPAPQTVKTIAGGSTEQQVVRADVANLDGTRTVDRGLLVTLTGTCKSGPTRLRAIDSKYENFSEERTTT